MNLYEISSQYQLLMQEIISCEELTSGQLDALESVDDSMQDKAKAVGAFIKNMEAEYVAIKEAIKTMEGRSEKMNAKIEYLKDYLKSNLERCQIKEVKSPYFDIKIKQNPASVIVNDETLVPLYYFKQKVIQCIDKGLLLVDLKNNLSIPGARLERRTRVEIK